MRTPGRLRRWLRLALPSAVAVLLADPVAAQTVDGRMVEAGSEEAVPGAAVMLLGESGRQLDFALTDVEGRFRLRAPGPGTFRIAFERIGYEGGESGAFALAAGEEVVRRLVVPVRPLALPPIEAVTERRCAVRPAEGEAASRIWAEIRKALEAASWTERRGALRYTLLAWERRLDPRTREVVDETTRRREGASRASPWVAEDAERLVREGFVRREGSDLLYDGPDAATILSDAFLDTHCFRAVPPPEGEPGWIGLAFAPDRSPAAVDVEGILWVDRRSSELRRLDFDYVGLPRDLRFDVAGGRVEFERVPTGEWIVRRWWIRMPIVGVSARTVASEMRMDASRNRPRLLGIEEEGGEVVASSRAVRRAAGSGSGDDAVRIVWSEPIPFEAGEALAPRGAPAPAVMIAADRGSGPGARANDPGTPDPPGVVIEAVDAETGAPIEGVQVALRASGDGGRPGPTGIWS
ncbi:MAG: carboxypeptidase-like regulatory domain-containing protein [Gemmatimonadetes bacterium]|nr:carboxypeptidase-like regulatory domain-containing protein [Gemmatimonadota bacterium]